MNKKLRLLFFTGLAAVFCASCSKVEELLPESYNHNGKSFSVEKVPVEGGTITLDRGRVIDSVYSIIRLNPSDTISSFKAGDTIILTATPTNGYTFINWVRNGVGISTEPIYKFCLEGKDVDNGHVKYHYEARFGNDYAIQSIPSIDEVMPADLIAIMGPHLHFGDNPPLLYKTSINSILGFSAKKPILLDYYAVDSSSQFCQLYFPHNPEHPEIVTTLPTEKNNSDFFLFHDQHRCIAQVDYKCVYVDTLLPIGSDFVELRYYDIVNTTDSVFVMGNSNYFTAYFHQHRYKQEYYLSPNAATYNIYMPHPVIYGSHEAVIMSGKITNDGVEDLFFAIKFIGYDDPSGAGDRCANIGDIIVYHHDYLPFSYWNPNN
jgi:hypothetical protein